MHEAYLRLVDQRRLEWNDRGHFFGAAANVMRRVLVDQARRRLADKRGGGAPHDDLDLAVRVAIEPDLDVLALNEALDALTRVDPQRARIVELRYFVGLSLDETASVAGISPQAVSRDWTAARAWLARWLERRAIDHEVTQWTRWIPSGRGFVSELARIHDAPAAERPALIAALDDDLRGEVASLLAAVENDPSFLRLPEERRSARRHQARPLRPRRRDRPRRHGDRLSRRTAAMASSPARSPSRSRAAACSARRPSAASSRNGRFSPASIIPTSSGCSTAASPMAGATS